VELGAATLELHRSCLENLGDAVAVLQDLAAVINELRDISFQLGDLTFVHSALVLKSLRHPDTVRLIIECVFQELVRLLLGIAAKTEPLSRGARDVRVGHEVLHIVWLFDT
jgi:hypothetical protein